MTLAQLDGSSASPKGSRALRQPRALALLRAALSGERVQHAYLFHGPQGAGKEQAARFFAQALTCPEQPGEGCGVCPSCVRIEHGNHPDVAFLMSEDAQVRRKLAGRTDFGRTPSRDIRVEQVRGLQERLVRRPLEAPRKVALVLEAEALNPAAQNAFLKTLEEPPADTVLVLVTSAPDQLLPTVQSRLSRIPFGPPPREIGAELGPDDAERVRAFEALALEPAPVADVRPLLRYAEAHGGSRDDAEATLRTLLHWNAEVAAVRAGAKASSEALAPLAREVAGRTDAVRLDRRHRLLAQTLEIVVERNGSPRLQLDGMLLELFA